MGFHVGIRLHSFSENQSEEICRNYKPTDSDLEGMDEDDSDDDDPSTWFEDDQDDGIKGQDIIPPDVEELSNVIRVDESRIRYSTFYEPRDVD